MAVRVDARGLSCPQPVIVARSAIVAGDFPVEVLVDSVTSRENVRRMAQKQGLRVEVEAQGDEYCLTLDR